MMDSINQGEFGTCFFIGALQCQAALLPALHIEGAIVAHHMDNGAYVCRFQHLGRWKCVTVDDKLPCFTSSGHPGKVSNY